MVMTWWALSPSSAYLRVMVERRSCGLEHGLVNLHLLMLRSPEQQLLRTTSQSGEGWDGRGNGQLLIHPGISGCISQPANGAWKWWEASNREQCKGRGDKAMMESLDLAVE